MNYSSYLGGFQTPDAGEDLSVQILLATGSGSSRLAFPSSGHLPEDGSASAGRGASLLCSPCLGVFSKYDFILSIMCACPLTIASGFESLHKVEEMFATCFFPASSAF